MRRFALALIVALLSPLFIGAAPRLSDDDAAALDAVSAYLNGITTLKGHFIQVDPSGNVEDGTFYIEKPGRMRFEYNPPIPTLIVSDGHTVAVANRRLNTVDRYPLWETPLNAILGNDINIRHSGHLLGIARQPGLFIVRLRTNQAKSKADLAITFSAPDYELRQWTVIDNQGLSTTLALSDVQVGADVPASLFILPDKNPFAHKKDE